MKIMSNRRQTAASSTRAACLLALLVASMTTAALSGDGGVDPAFGVYDHADLLSDAEEKALASAIADMRAAHAMSFSIVTAADTGGKSDMVFADDYFERHILVPGQPRDGILLFVNIRGRGIWISTHGGAIDRFSDKTLDGIIAKIARPLGRGDYHDGCRLFLAEAAWVCESRKYRVAGFIAFGGFGAGIAVLAFLLFRHRARAGRVTHARRYLSGDSAITLVDAKFVRSYTTSTRKADSDSSSGGSSTHQSSGGSTFGGRGGSF